MAQTVIPLLIDGKVYQALHSVRFRIILALCRWTRMAIIVIIFLLRKRSMRWISCSRQLKRGYFDPGQMTLDDGGLKAAALSGRVFCFIGSTHVYQMLPMPIMV